MGNRMSTDDQIFRLKLKIKELEQLATRSEMEEKKLINEVKKAIQAGKIDVAKIHAEKCIRKKNEKINYLNLGNKLDVLVCRLEGAHRCSTLAKDINTMLPLIQKINAETNPVKIGNNVTKLDIMFDEINLTSDMINDTIQTAATVNTPEDEVNELITKVAEEHAIALDGKIGTTPVFDKHLEEMTNMSERIKNLK